MEVSSSCRGVFPDDVSLTGDPKLFCLCKYVSNILLVIRNCVSSLESWRSEVAVEAFPDHFCPVTIQNYFVFAFVQYGNKVSEQIAESSNTAVEIDFRSVIR